MARIFIYKDTDRNPDLCAASVNTDRRGVRQCGRTVAMTGLVNGKRYRFCKLHHPTEVEKREKERSDRWNKQVAREEAQLKREHYALRIADKLAKMPDREIPKALRKLVTKYKNVTGH